MLFHNPTASVMVPDGLESEAAFGRTTHLAIGTHPDDIEFMTWKGILECFASEERYFAGVTVTNGSGSSRIGEYEHFTDEQMVEVRRGEQYKAACVGGYSFLGTLGYSSAQLRGSQRQLVREDLVQLLQAVRPQVIYTHNLADRHDSHIATAVSVVEALRLLGPDYYPQELWGGEVWRSLDWLTGADRHEFDVSKHSSLTMALMGVYDSQIAGGKRYDLATSGRRQANATYNDAYHPDKAALLELGMDLMPLLRDPLLKLTDYLESLIAGFSKDVIDRLRKTQGK